MGILQVAARVFGFPLAAAVHSDLMASPFGTGVELAAVDLAALFGIGENFRVSRSRSMQLGTIAAGRNTITGTISRLDLYVEKSGTRLPIQPAVLSQLEAGVPISTTLRWTVDALIFYPVAWWIIRERDSYGWPARVEWVPNGKAQTDAYGNLVSVSDELISPDDVIRFDSPNGSGLLIDAARTIQRAMILEESAALAEDNPVPTMELHNSGDRLEPAEIAELMDMWSAARRRRGVAYTSKAITAIPHGTQVTQLLIEGRKAINLDLIRHLNIPAWAAEATADGASLQYENRQSRNWELIDISCAPFMDAIAGRLSLPDFTPRGWRVKFDTDELTRPDLAARFNTYAVGLGAGFIDQAWIANEEGWPLPAPVGSIPA